LNWKVSFDSLWSDATGSRFWVNSTKKDSDHIFEPVAAAEERARLLVDAVKHKAAAKIWTPNKSLSFTSRPTKVDESELFFRRPADLSDDRLLEAIDSDPTHAFRVALSHDLGGLFFKTKYIHASEKILVFARPDEVYRVQRRQHFRLIVPSGEAAWASTGDRAEPRHPIHDISLGGVSFKVAATTAPSFLKDALLSLQLTLDETTIDTQARVKNVFEIPVEARESREAPSHRVAAEFEGIHERQRNQISSYIMVMSRKKLSNYL
jgi:hypothetical protein